MTTAEIARLEDDVIEAVQVGDYPKARRLIDAAVLRGGAAEDYQRLYAEQRAINAKLDQQLTALQKPPLFCGVVLGRSHDDPAAVIIGTGGSRCEVQVAPNANLDVESLTPGLEAWLNQDKQLVKVRPPALHGEVAEVTALLPDGQLEVRGRSNTDLVVEPVPALRDLKPAVGDRVRIDPQLSLALDKLPAQENKELELETVPDVTYEDIGGLDEHITQLREAIELPYLYHHLFRRYNLRRPKGILLYGPPGCGKTMMAKAIANSLSSAIATNLRQVAGALRLFLHLRCDGESLDAVATDYAVWLGSVEETGWRATTRAAGGECGPAETLETFLASRGAIGDQAALATELERVEQYLASSSRAYFISIKGPELLNKWVGETELSIRRLFLQAKRRASPATPVVLFFDEIEALFRQRGSRTSSDMESTIVPQLLTEIDGVEELRDVILIGATNRQDLLDPAILRPGRLDIKIKIDRPKRAGAEAILRKYLTVDLPLAASEESAGDVPNAARDRLIERAVRLLYAEESALHVTGRQVEGRKRTLPWSQFVTGALLENVVARAKRRAVRREIAGGAPGISWDDLAAGLRQEFEENRDQLVSTTLQIAETGLTIEVSMAEEDMLTKDPEEPAVDPFLRLAVRPWRSSGLRERTA